VAAPWPILLFLSWLPGLAGAPVSPEADAWCSDRCSALYGTERPEPGCALEVFEHEIRDGRVVLVPRPDLECQVRYNAWEALKRKVATVRKALRGMPECMAWCRRVAALRGEEPFDRELTSELWLVLAGVDTCDVSEDDVMDLSLFPMDVQCRGMRLVPEGEFMMGCNDAVADCQEDQKPLHVVYLSAYFIDRHEVTVAAYQMCVGKGPCSAPVGNDVLKYYNWGAPDRDGHPVNGVTWHQAEQYCGWAGKRLCTEAEWEKGARGTDGRVYPWGTAPPNRHYAVMDDGLDDEGGKRPWPVLSTTSTVCSREAGNSPYGLCDMAGNVWEWVADWYSQSYYEVSARSDPAGPSKGDLRGIRGGRYSHVGFSLASHHRGRFLPTDQFAYLGFRCCRSAGQPPARPAGSQAVSPLQADSRARPLTAVGGNSKQAPWRDR